MCDPKRFSDSLAHVSAAGLACSFWTTSSRQGLFHGGTGKRSKLLVLDLCDDFDLSLGLLESTVHVGNSYVAKGAFHEDNTFVLLTRSVEDLQKLVPDPRLLQHSGLTVALEREAHWTLYTLDDLKQLSFKPRALVLPDRIIVQPNGNPDFKNYPLRVAIMPWTTNTIAVELAEPHTMGNVSIIYGDYAGFEVDLLKAIAQVLNVRFEFLNPSDGEWGTTRSDGTWTGMVDLARRGEVDFMMGDNMMTYNRFRVLDYTFGFGSDYMTYCTPNPSLQANWKRLLSPFDPYMWLCIGLSTLAGSVLLWAVQKAYFYLLYSARMGESLATTLWYCYGAFMGESMGPFDQFWPIRVFIGFWMFYAFVLTSSYAGNLVAFITTPVYTKPITSLKELIESDLPWAMVLYGEEEEQFMATSQDPTIQTIWRDKLVVDFSPTPDVAQVRSGQRAFIDYRSGLELAIYLNHSTPAGVPLVYLSPYPVFKTNPVGFGFHKFNPFRRQFDRIIHRTIETGLMAKWYEKALNQLKEDLGNRVDPRSNFVQSGFRPFMFYDLEGISMFYGLLIVGCLVTLLYEIIAFRVRSLSVPRKTREELM